jgi:hypothetical protein
MNFCFLTSPTKETGVPIEDDYPRVQPAQKDLGGER